MDVFMSNIIPGTTVHQLKSELSGILHLPPFREPDAPLINFHIHLFPRKPRATWQSAILTLPTDALGQRFIQIYGGADPQRQLLLNGIRICFETGRRQPQADVLERIRRQQFEDPRLAQERERIAAESQALEVQLSTIQFGWECRDRVYSVEWEKSCSASLGFNPDRREFLVKVPGAGMQDTRFIAIRASQIAYATAGVHERSATPAIFFSLSNPPAFESEPVVSSLATATINHCERPLRRRWSAHDTSHEPIAPYTSLAIRLECADPEGLSVFRKMAQAAHVHPPNYACHVERRGLFSDLLRDQYCLWAQKQPWTVAFQVEALLRSWLLDFKEVLQLRRPIESVLRQHGREYTTALLRDYTAKAKALYWYGEDSLPSEDGVPVQLVSQDPMELFSYVRTNFVHKPMNTAFINSDALAPFHCLRVTVTPTTILLEGPFPEQSNRVMRTYYRDQDSFLRVAFQEENRLQLRFDREVDGRDFVNRRVKKILLEGINIAGAQFDFLAYSQSALKEHAVWFVKPFQHIDSDGYRYAIDAPTIIESVGTFRNLTFDPMLIRCPARYAARISQAFTATDASISIDVGQIMHSPDIKDAAGKWAFTDGVGTISPQLAKDIWRALLEKKGRGRRDRTYPRAYQIRFQGSKGMVSVDHTLPDRSILLRPSMIKFENPTSLVIEIARAFDRPGVYYLNRPLIMLLEGLGVDYEVFQRLQDDAVRDVKESVTSLDLSATLLEKHGLGASFRLSSAVRGLHKLGRSQLEGDDFWDEMMEFAANHVMRELKHHARIPVPDSWTLVGVADVHGYLEEGEVFACIDSPKSEDGPIYLEGRALVSRSPTIHPGDVQVVTAIGPPPADSPFAHEPLPNTIVFSTKGKRPLPSCLGGGDLDGDVYNVTTRDDFTRVRTYPPASYDPAPKRLVDHDSTMDDVADFVAEFITSDTVGIIAITWLIIADQSPEGILDPDCVKLAALHSDAVDYPKSGQPVPIDKIPRLKFRLKPDWNAPEIMNEEGAQSFYESVRAIGKLYRSIDLPAIRGAKRVARKQRRHMQNGAATAEDIWARFNTDEPDEDAVVVQTVRHRVEEFINPKQYDKATVTGMYHLYSTYVSRLRAICASHTLSNLRTAMLTEAEAVVGTIVAKCSQPRKRKDLIAQLKEQTAILAGDMRREITGDDDMPVETALSRAWIAFRLANIEGELFGARSFAWLALGAVFDTIREIEKADG
ncbi:RdRP-domain-containing protein [Trametes elegans]|nr:RdRP-domain-containing protein [Trametes elegans]